MKDILVSRFETYGDDFRFDNNKSICNIAVNIKEIIISFTLESGDAPSLYVVLLMMSVNRHWLNIVDSFEKLLRWSVISCLPVGSTLTHQIITSVMMGRRACL